MDSSREAAYAAILREELIPAFGCTEPISVALAAAKARTVLGSDPAYVRARCSGNLVKNAKAVYVPGTGGLRGIPASLAAGIAANAPEKGMQVLSGLNESDRLRMRQFLDAIPFEIEILEGEEGLHLEVFLRSASGGTALVEILHTHTNIIRVERDGVLLENRDVSRTDYTSALQDRSILDIHDIVEFAASSDLAPLADLLDAQIQANRSIAGEGLSSPWGLNIGNELLEIYGDTLWSRIRSQAAAGSDARMNGCAMPVVINSGSGNQGMTASLPVLAYAEWYGMSIDRLHRALVLSNLATIHMKTGIGRLSAYCGAMSAAAGAAAGITFLAGGDVESIGMAVTNTLAIVSGLVCDGAKSSCAAKIAAGLDSAILAHHLAMKKKAFEPGSGIVKDSVEKTVDAVGRLGRIGMRQTDTELLKIMLET